MDHKLKVFISYARRDGAEFAEELRTGLEIAGFDAFLDRHDIAAGEDWEVRLGRLIQTADTVVMVVTPGSVQSDRCAWEVDFARDTGKRIIPIVAIDVAEADTPALLRRQNYIFFTPGHSFTRSLASLAEALRTDLEWVREHTRLHELAARWEARLRAEPLLLRGSELEDARAWLSRWRPGAPEPTDRHRAYIGESETAANRFLDAEKRKLEQIASAQKEREEALKRLSRRTTIGLIATGTLLAGAIGLSAWGVNAESRVRREKRRALDNLIAEANRRDIAGQLTCISGAVRQGSAAALQTDRFTPAFLEQVSDDQVSLALAFSRANGFYRALPGRDRPFVASDLNGDIFLSRPSPTRLLSALVVSVSPPGREDGGSSMTDSGLWFDFLKARGFEPKRLNGPSRAELVSVVDDMAHAASRGGARLSDSMLLVYFSGGGVSMDNENYLLCSDSLSGNRDEVQASALETAYLTTAAREGAACSVVVFDTSFVDYRLASL